MKINLTHKWKAMESPLHYTTVECTWEKSADPPWKGAMLLKEAAQFPNVEIGGQGKAGRAWITGGGQGTDTGSLSDLQCIDTTKVKLITNADGTESFEYKPFILKETAPQQEEANPRKEQEARQKETVGSDKADATTAIA